MDQNMKIIFQNFRRFSDLFMFLSLQKQWTYFPKLLEFLRKLQFIRKFIIKTNKVGPWTNGGLAFRMQSQSDWVITTPESTYAKCPL